MARALAGVLDPGRLTAVVNVGDDDVMYSAYVAADLDTVTYTLAGIEGSHGWGIRDDSFNVMDEMSHRGLDTSFRLGDRDLATCLQRSVALAAGVPLSEITATIARELGVETRVLPVTDDRLSTRVRIADGNWLPFQEYFVVRRNADTVTELEYAGAEASSPAPGVLDAIGRAQLVVIAPSNPPLSIWPILAVPGVMTAVAEKERVVAVSPLFGGKALKGPADRVMASLGLAAGTAGILEAYNGLLSTLIVDTADSADESLSDRDTTILTADTRIADPEAGRRFARWLLETTAQ